MDRLKTIVVVPKTGERLDDMKALMLESLNDTPEPGVAVFGLFNGDTYVARNYMKSIDEIYIY